MALGLMTVLIGLALAGLTTQADEDPAPTPLPPSVRAMTGCWAGVGEVMGKPVRTQVKAHPVARNLQFVIETDSVAVDDPQDFYAAHIIIGATAARPDKPEGLVSYFADSFGGDFVSTGSGRASEEEVVLAYPYGANQFVNHWRASDTRLSWTITIKTAGQADQPFAHYELEAVPCA